MAIFGDCTPHAVILSGVGCQLGRLVSGLKATIHLQSIQEALENLPSSHRIGVELRERNFEARQIVRRDLVTAQDVPFDFLKGKRAGAPKALGANPWEL